MARKPLDPALLDFLDSSVDITTLTASSEQKVPVRCSRCANSYMVTFFSVYRQRQKGPYVCRPCTARENGKLAPKGFAKRTATSRVRYGVDHYTQNASVYVTRSRSIQDIWQAHVDVNGHPMHNEVSRAKLVQTNLNRHGVPYSTLLPQVQNTLTVRQTSQSEQDLRDFLVDATGCSWDADWTSIAPKQLDCYNAHHRCAVEYNGLVWHSEKMGKTRWSHFRKYEACRSKGIRLFTIFEDEWATRREQVKAVLRARLGHFDVRLGARQTEATLLPTNDAMAYVASWHLQPQRSALYAVALTHHTAVIGVMTFTRHHRQSNSLVLSRMCFAPGYQIIGGASKLLTFARPHLRAAGWTHLVSWSDNRWSEGNIYRHLGWTLDAELAPDYSYVDLRHGTRRSKQSCRKHALGAADTQTERERATELGLFRIWDCGKRRWTLTI